jgi:hypothetical protein
MTGCRLGASICSKGQVVHAVGAYHLGRVAALVAERDFDAAVGAFDDVEVGEDVAGLSRMKPEP